MPILVRPMLCPCFGREASMYDPAKGVLFFAEDELTIGRDCVNRMGQTSATRSSSGLPGFYRPELDSLRFFAFLMVFLSHSDRFVPASYFSTRIWRAINAILTTGSWGVDLFFVLSAYLITELLRREKEATGKVHIGSFYARRILRIWPLYFLVIGLGYLAQFVWSSQHLPTNYILWFLFLGETGFARCTDFLTPSSPRFGACRLKSSFTCRGHG